MEIVNCLFQEYSCLFQIHLALCMCEPTNWWCLQYFSIRIRMHFKANHSNEKYIFCCCYLAILCQPVIGGTKCSSASTATHSCRPSTLPLIFLPFRLIVLRLKQYIYLLLFFLRWISLYIYTKRLEYFERIEHFQKDVH